MIWQSDVFENSAGGWQQRSCTQLSYFKITLLLSKSQKTFGLYLG